jgi:DNA-binding LacI/PurR family transcriptional regulator
MADIAARAGLALSTVSYALSGKRPLSERTRARVLSAVDELGYRPHAPARALASRSSRTIALFQPSAHWRGMPEHTFVAGVAQATSEADYGLLFSDAPSDPEQVARLLDSGRSDGVLLMEIHLHDERVEWLRRRGDAFALIGHCAENSGVSFVDFDFADAVRKSVAHLAELGHCRIALFNCGRAAPDYGPAVRAREAFDAVVAELGLQGVVINRDDTQRGVAAAARRLFARDPSCCGVVTVAANFTGVLAAAGEAGRRVGADLDVVSLVTPEVAERYLPALTTVDFPALEMGRLAAEMLIRQLAGDREPTQILLRGKLRVRPARRAASQRVV